MLIYQIYWRIKHPRRVVGAPSLHVADNHDIRIFGVDGIIEPGIAATVLEACLRLTVLIAYLDEFKSVWFLVAVGDASSSPLCGFIAVGILNGIQGILHQGIHLLERHGEAMSQTYVHHKHRCGIQVFAQLQILIISQSVGRTVVPVVVPMPRALFYRTQCRFPSEGVLITVLSFHVASARETEETWFGIIEELCQVGAQSVGASFPGGRHQRHHIQVEGAVGRRKKGKASVAAIGCGLDGCRELYPFVGFQLTLQFHLFRGSRAIRLLQLAIELAVEAGRCLDP